MLRALLSLVVLSLCLPWTSSGHSPQKAHVHGLGKVQIAFDGKKGKIQLELPGESLFGFEHEAVTKSDKRKKDQALKTLEEKISEMIVLEESLKCEIKKDIFEVNQAKNHSDVEAEFNVTCEKNLVDSTRLVFYFQKHFPRLKKIQIDVLADSIQKSLEVSKDGDVLELK